MSFTPPHASVQTGKSSPHASEASSSAPPEQKVSVVRRAKAKHNVWYLLSMGRPPHTFPGYALDGTISLLRDRRAATNDKGKTSSTVLSDFDGVAHASFNYMQKYSGFDAHGNKVENDTGRCEPATVNSEGELVSRQGK